MQNGEIHKNTRVERRETKTPIFRTKCPQDETHKYVFMGIMILSKFETLGSNGLRIAKNRGPFSAEE